MLLRRIRCFIEVVESGSFTLAAHNLNISQPAVSQQIKSLEEDLGVQLVKSHKRSFVLTPSGEYFYAQMKIVLQQFDSIALKTVALGQIEETCLNLGCYCNWEGDELSRAGYEFSKLYPDVKLSFTSANHEKLSSLLMQDSLDLILSNQSEDLGEDYETLELGECECFVELNETDPLSKKKNGIEIGELNDRPLILASYGSLKEKEENYYRQSFGIRSPVIYAQNIEIIHVMVENSLGYTLLANVHMKKEGLVHVPLLKNGERACMKFYALWKKSRNGSYVEEFARLLAGLFDSKQ